MDFAIARTIQFGGGRGLQLRLDVFNSFNQAAITNRNASVTLFESGRPPDHPELAVQRGRVGDRRPRGSARRGFRRCIGVSGATDNAVADPVHVLRPPGGAAQGAAPPIVSPGQEHHEYTSSTRCGPSNRAREHAHRRLPDGRVPGTGRRGGRVRALRPHGHRHARRARQEPRAVRDARGTSRSPRTPQTATRV